MKKILITYSVFFIFSIILAKQVAAEENTNVNIFIDGQVSIDTQINGVSIDYNEDTIDINELYIEVQNNDIINKYEDFKRDLNYNESYKFYGTINKLEKDDKLIIYYKIKSNSLNIDSIIKKEYFIEELLDNENTDNDEENYNIVITSNELKNEITYDIIFKSDIGGFIEDGQDNIEYINILPNTKFPDMPNIVQNKNYEFVGWYDEIENCYIETFPEFVERDYIYCAKWKNTKERGFINKEDLLNIELYNPSNSVKENNILLRIVSYIICLTTSV